MSVTPESVTDPNRSTYTRVLPVGPGVCQVCHGAPNPGATICSSCRWTMDGVSRPVRLVVPISLCEIPSQLYTSLKDYKRPYAAAHGRFELEIAALLHRFLQEHAAHIREAASREWDALTIVPSTRREAPYPMEGVIRKSHFLTEMYRPLLKKGAATVSSRTSDDDMFATTQDVAGLHVLLVDDTLTSGAHLQSAASRLQLDGADVVAAVAIGRIFHPEYAPQNQQLWDRAKAEPFDFEMCCLE